jgi:hypothetical protein
VAKLPPVDRPLESSEGRPLRICLDLNVFVAALLATERGRRDTAAQSLVESVRRGDSALGPMQLVVSWGMLNRLGKVLEREFRVPRDRTDLYLQAIAAYAALGPERLDPLLTLGGTGIIAMRDEEDRHVLETAAAGGAGLVVTSNLGDFAIRDTEILEADRVLEYPGPRGRLVIAHPFRVAEWLRQGRISLPERGGRSRHSSAASERGA